MSCFKDYSVLIPIEKLHPKQFDVIVEVDRGSAIEHRAHLLEDIKQRGILVPLMVQERLPDEPGEYNVICGITRYHIADLLLASGDQRFKELRCDILKDGMDAPQLENTAILDNLNRRMITSVARHMMIARYKEQLGNIVAPYQNGKGHYQFTPASGQSGSLTPSEEEAKAAIDGIHKQGSLDKHVAHVLGINHDTVHQADRTMASIRYKLNQRANGSEIKKAEPRVARIVEELKKEKDEYRRDIFRTPVKKQNQGIWPMDFGEFIRSKGYYEVRIYSGHYVGRKPRLNIQVPRDKNRKFHLIREEIVSLGRGILRLAHSPQPFPHQPLFFISRLDRPSSVLVILVFQSQIIRLRRLAPKVAPMFKLFLEHAGCPVLCV